MGCVLSGHRSDVRPTTKDDPKDEPPRRFPESTAKAIQFNKPKPKLKPAAQQPAEQPWVPSSPRDASFAPPKWPPWLVAAAGDALDGWTPRRADSFQKLSKIGSGTYSNVYKVRDMETGRVMALKKVRFDAVEKESVRFMAREIAVLRRLDHPNVIKLEGLAISRVSPALYLIFEYMEHDLAGLAAAPGIKFSEAQIKCYMKQLLSGLEHCHGQGVLHRDIKGSNLLLDNQGVLKIADFGLATTFDTENKKPMTSRVVTLWYRPPELLLGATYYDVGVDLWSAGCILAELLSGKPILPGRSEVEQLHKIFKLCGSPSEKYWKKSKFPYATIVKPQQCYERCLAQTFKDFPPSALSLVDKLLAIEPTDRGTATDAMNSEFFTTEPYACEPSSLPQYPPSKEMDAKLREEKAKRQRVLDKSSTAVKGKSHVHNRRSRAVPAPEANAELHINLEKRKWMARVNATTSKSEKFPPPHQDGVAGIPFNDLKNRQFSFIAYDSSFASSIFKPSEDDRDAENEGIDSIRSSRNKEAAQVAANHALVREFKQSTINLKTNLKGSSRTHWRKKGQELEVFGNHK